MLRLTVPSTRARRSIRFASQLSRSQTDSQHSSPGVAGSGQKPSILSRLSNITQSKIRRNSDTEQKSPNPHGAASERPRSRATSFVSTRSARQRDLAAEKWFKDVRQLDIDIVGQSKDLSSLSREGRTGPEFLEQREMRPRTDLNALFSLPTARSATSLRLQSKRELGGDYTSYLPDGCADPYRLPIDYARSVLGRNKYISLNAQTGALNILEEAIRGRKTRHVV